MEIYNFMTLYLHFFDFNMSKSSKICVLNIIFTDIRFFQNINVYYNKI